MPRSQTILRYIVLISFKPGVLSDIREKVYRHYQTLGEKCGGKKAGILDWRVEHNLDLRKGVHLVEVAVFKNNKSLQTYRRHPAHVDFVENLVRHVADWQVGALYEPAP